MAKSGFLERWPILNPPERWVAVLGISIFSTVALAGFAIAIYAAWLFHDMPDASDLVDYRPPTATRVYAWDGTLIGEFSRERRIFVPYDNVPPQLVQAFLAAEDHNFFTHSGVDVQGLGRAMAKNVLNAVQGKRLEGGSTITQQVAKNVLLTSDATVGRKLKEAILARRLEQTLNKQQILELYLNEIWLGYRSYGVGAAAYNYFGKSLNDLTLAQCAFLASLPKGPDNYHPILHKANAIGRRNWVLGQMAEMRWITQAQAQAAMAEDLKVQAAPSRAKYKDADYFVEEVRQRGLQTLGPRLTEGGYYMRTTLDPKLQTAAREALMDGLENYDHRHGWRGAWGTTTLAPGWEKAALVKKPPSERRDWHAAIVESVDGGVRVRPAKDLPPGVLAGEDVAWARAGKGLNVGDLVFVAPSDSGAYRLKQVPLVNGAIVAMEPQTGRVLAMVGGYSFSLSNFNRATQAMRQPGSAFKPIVYATALENDFTPASIITDAPMNLKGANGETWSPENYYKKFYGPQPMRRGLELSINGMTVRLAQDTGMVKVRDMAIKLGVVDQMEPVLAMALGAGETTPFRLTAAYASFVNGGRKIQPHLIELVENREGEVIYQADKRACQPCKAAFNGDEGPRLIPTGEQVMDPITAYQITSMLQGVVQRGTGAAVSSLGYPLAGKTGTTNEYRSAWFMGYSPNLVVGVFVGFDDNRSLGEGETGAQDAVPIFISFMKVALEGKPKTDFTPPKDAKFMTVAGVREAFKPGSEPRGPSGPAAPKPEGPVLYNQAWPDGKLKEDQAPPPPTKPPPKPKIPDDLTGLY
ncbi:penicillin-binding protein 1A [Caulobacter ginsengisoli]|uniref:Penicillin-binding protein 1A n=1 Tax=Caulobacter ginsengisoli TaxID=400775 RepID=A0ABU0ILM9_9CAUL|nr:penicillin-binding protein 1A [Caulobacter ginsengisoli]MDQ0462874.1 penicillin-binding protein 1A [Caulobacter ginsengisoli]